MSLHAQRCVERIGSQCISLERAGEEEWQHTGYIDDPNALGYYHLDRSKQSYLEWTLKNAGENLTWFRGGISFRPIFLPVPTIPFELRTETYSSRSRFHADASHLPTVIENLEDAIDERHGLEYEGWSVPIELSAEKISCYFGSNAEGLKQALNNVETGIKRFGWIFFTGSVIYTIGGAIYRDDTYSLEIRREINFIPNYFPFVTIREDGRTDPQPLSVNKTSPLETEEWSTPIGQRGLGENPDDSALCDSPKAIVKGYIGDTPRERAFENPFRQHNGMTIISVGEKLNDLEENVHQFIRDADPLVGITQSAPRGLNDQEEVRITNLSLSGRPEPIQPLESQLVLFNLNFSLHQVSDLRIESDE